jgi:hypothetical protein
VGTYNVYARGVSYTQAGGYVKLATISVQAAPAGPPTDTNTGSGQKSDGSKPATDPNTSKQTSSTTTATTQKSGELAAPNGMKELALGVVVVLMDDSLVKECGLQAGQCGTIVACEGPGHTGMVLVSWPFFSRGVQDACKDDDGMPVAYPLKSARWIDTKTIPLGLCFDECGVLTKGQGGVILLKVDDSHMYNLIGADALNEQVSAAGRFHIGDHVRTRGLRQIAGLRTNAASGCPRQQGDVYGPVLTFTAGPEEKTHDQCPGDKLLLDFVNHQVWLYRDPACPGGKHRLTGTTSLSITTGWISALEATVYPCPGVGGTWKASLSVDQTARETPTTVKIYVDVDDIDLTNMPAGKQTLVAQLFFGTNK